MIIKQFQLTNHKGFLDSEKMEFYPGINIIAGKNNSGKSALLEALSIDSFTNIPHKSSAMYPRETSPRITAGSIQVKYEVPGYFIKDWLLSQTQSLGIPLPEEVYNPNLTAEAYRPLIETFFRSENIPIELHATTTNGNAPQWNQDIFPAIKLYKPVITHHQQQQYVQIFIQSNPTKSDYIISSIQRNARVVSEMGFHIGPSLHRRIYKFDAERFNIGVCNIGTTILLAKNASNLPEVLNNLSSRSPQAYAQYNSLVQKIFPEIKYIGVKPISSGQVEIFIRTDEIERDDLTFKLSECGTGLSQVLAILYVAFSNREPKVIIIDEPNSFLHPGATKTLLGILSTFKQHQYIISSHSADIFKTPGVSSLKLVTKTNNVSSVKSLSLLEVNQTKECLLELGIEISDILASDKNIWGEGPTEKHCFPLILRKLKDWKDFTTSFLSTKSTGDFEGKGARLAMDIYNRMTSGNLILPSKTLFIFDPEERTPTEIEDLKRRGAEFLPRRMYENYLIHPAAIKSALSELGENKISNEVIQSWLNNNGQKFVPKEARSKLTALDIPFLQQVNGAKLLQNLFQELTDGRQTYNKISTGIFLTDWILANSPDSLTELSSFLGDIFAER